MPAGSVPTSLIHLIAPSAFAMAVYKVSYRRPAVSEYGLAQKAASRWRPFLQVRASASVSAPLSVRRSVASSSQYASSPTSEMDRGTTSLQQNATVEIERQSALICFPVGSATLRRAILRKLLNFDPEPPQERSGLHPTNASSTPLPSAASCSLPIFSKVRVRAIAVAPA